MAQKWFAVPCRRCRSLAYEALRALNFSKGHTLFHVILPQAVVEMMPAFGNLAIHSLKDTALPHSFAISDLAFNLACET